MKARRNRCAANSVGGVQQQVWTVVAVLYLCEELLEVLERQLGPAADCGQRRIIAHGAERLVGGLGHGHHEHLEGLAGVPKERGGKVRDMWTWVSGGGHAETQSPFHVHK